MRNAVYASALLLGWRITRALVPAALLVSLPKSWTTRILGSAFALPYLGSLSLGEVMVFSIAGLVNYLSSGRTGAYGATIASLKAVIITAIWRYLVVPILHA